MLLFRGVIVGLGPGGLGLGITLSNNPFHKGIPGIQTTGPQNQQLTISWVTSSTIPGGHLLWMVGSTSRGTYTILWHLFFFPTNKSKLTWHWFCLVPRPFVYSWFKKTSKQRDVLQVIATCSRRLVTPHGWWKVRESLLKSPQFRFRGVDIN